MTNGTRTGWGVSFTPWPLFTPGQNLVPIVQEAGLAPGPAWTGAENLAPTGIRSPDRPAHSQSLYRLRYPAHRNTVHGPISECQNIKTVVQAFLTISKLEVIKCLNATTCLLIRGKREEIFLLLNIVCWELMCFCVCTNIYDSRRWKKNVPPNSQYPPIRLHSLMSRQKAVYTSTTPQPTTCFFFGLFKLKFLLAIHSRVTTLFVVTLCSRDFLKIFVSRSSQACFVVTVLT